MPTEQFIKEATEKTGNLLQKHGKGALVAAVLILGAASLTDLVMDRTEAKNIEEEKKKANKKADERQKEDEKKYGELGYGYETYDEIVEKAGRGYKLKKDPVLQMLPFNNAIQNMYDNRNGHHKMGSAKFK